MPDDTTQRPQTDSELPSADVLIADLEDFLRESQDPTA